MMEVKQNTAVDLNDLLTSSKSNGSDEVDDAVMADLTDRNADLVHCDIMKADDKATNVVCMANGNIINDLEVDRDVNVPVNPELEDVLLAGEDILPKLNSKQVEPVPAAAEDDILADKVETSNSTTSSSNLRDPGDDLDTLLSKINDIVEDCIENEVDNNVVSTEKLLESVNTSLERSSEKNENLTEGVLYVAETKMNEEHEKMSTEDRESNAVTTSKEAEVVSPPTPATEKIVKTTENDYHDTDKGTIDSVTNLSPEKDSNLTSLSNIINEPKSEEIQQEQEKTEHCKLVAVQDNEITSNSDEIHEGLRNQSTEGIVTTDGLKSPIRDAKLVDTENNVQKDDDKKSSVEDLKSNEQNENEDSDDEIVFYVDKPPDTNEKISKGEEKPVNTEEVNETLATEENEVSKSQQEETSIKKINQDDDDDVVLLLDDDEDEANPSLKEENHSKGDSSKTQEESIDRPMDDGVAAEKPKDIDMDNSDNARDDFVSEKSKDSEKITNKTVSTEAAEEANSNCSSSSNLLQEAKSVENADEPTPEDCENEEDDDEGDVELIDSELKDTDSTTKVDDSELPPPAKRLRLSEDSVQSSKAEEASNDQKEGDISGKENEPIEDLEAKESTEASPSTLKRSHDVIELEEKDEKSNDSKVSNDSTHKKLRTTEVETDLKPVEPTEEKKPSEDTKSAVDVKSDIKAIPSYQPISLYPPPKFGSLKSESSLKIDFLKKFRKSFDNMSKQDLEELVLQKVVEAIIHRSEFSEMRELIEKQEKLITAHRSKISELSKQFRDLEMVHNRVVKDIEQRNSQFIMPVKITRAVGLQVYIPNKKSIAEATSSTNNTTSNSSSSPQRPLTNQAPSVSSSTVNPPQRQFLTLQAEAQQQRVASSTPNANTTAGGVRRGCAQKITPIRPVPGNNQTPPAVSPVNSAIYRSTPNQSVSSQPRILNKNATQPPNAVNVQRSRYLGSNQEGQRLPTQQQVARPPNITASGQRVAPIAAAQPKAPLNTPVAVQRSSSTGSSSSIVDNYLNTLTHLGGGNTAVSITPAKPKEKAVIDLTDEDEAPSQPSSGQSTAQNSNPHSQRRSLPVQNNTNSQLQYGRSAPPLARIPPAPNNKNRQMSAIQAQKNNNSFAAINTPPGTSITRINVSSNAASVQRVKYSHPAPLPATPPQAFNPAWKLPPPRPTIRISNLDNGIVISWTMEESMDRHAECVSYQIYAYQETSGPPMVDSWRHVGDVKAMLLPMAVTLTQFQEGQRYFFAVRAVDCHQRFGPFSLPKTWS